MRFCRLFWSDRIGRRDSGVPVKQEECNNPTSYSEILYCHSRTCQECLMQLRVDDTVKVIHPIHPFPARMAPEIALQESARLAAGSLVLDPMAGSGTVLRTASEWGHRAYGYDMDPLAVLMARVWTTPLDPDELRDAVDDFVARVQGI